MSGKGLSKQMPLNLKDFLAGVIFAVVGVFFCVYALTDLRLGTTFRMGPAYFPVLVGGILVVLGIAISIRSAGSASLPIGPISWRSFLLIALAPITFGATVRGLGLVPALAMSVLLSAFASRRVNVLSAIALTIGLTGFCVLVFKMGLGLTLRLFGPWIGG